MTERRPPVEDIRARDQNIEDTAQEPLLILDDALRVRSANPSSDQTFHVSPGETGGRLIHELGNGWWDIPAEDKSPARSPDEDGPPAIGPRLRLDYLDGLRGLLAFYVTACHAYLTYAVLFDGRANDPLADSLLWGTGWLGLGRSAVAGFIVVSGYCLMLPVARSSDGRLRGGMLGFLRHRARRILPPYYGALLVSLALIAAVPGLREGARGAWQAAFWRQVFPAFSPGVLLSHVFLVHNYHHAWQHAIDYPMWSLATEWQIYFLFPAFVATWRRKTIGHVVIHAMRITLLLQVLLMVAFPGVNPWPPQFVLLFAFGMAGATVSYPRKDEVPGRRMRWGWLASGLFALFVALQFTVGGLLRDLGFQQAEDLLVGGAVACLLIYCGRARTAGSNPPALRLLEARPLVVLGRFSYSLYLIHAPILAVTFLAIQSLGFPCAVVQVAMLGLGLPLSVLAAYLFYLAFERPFLRRPPSEGDAAAESLHHLPRRIKTGRS